MSSFLVESLLFFSVPYLCIYLFISPDMFSCFVVSAAEFVGAISSIRHVFEVHVWLFKGKAGKHSLQSALLLSSLLILKYLLTTDIVPALTVC